MESRPPEDVGWTAASRVHCGPGWVLTRLANVMDGKGEDRKELQGSLAGSGTRAGPIKPHPSPRTGLCASAESWGPLASPAGSPEMPWVPGSRWKLHSPVDKKAEPRVTQTWVQILRGRGAYGTFLETSCIICKVWIIAVPTSCGAGWVLRWCVKRLAEVWRAAVVMPGSSFDGWGACWGWFPPLPTQNIL